MKTVIKPYQLITESTHHGTETDHLKDSACVGRTHCEKFKHITSMSKLKVEIKAKWCVFLKIMIITNPCPES